MRPIETETTIRWPDGRVLPAKVTIFPKAGSLEHPVQGYSLDGTTTLRFNGTMQGVEIIEEPPAQRGRPPSAAVTARAIGIFLAHQALTRWARPHEDSTIGAEHLANRIVFEWWQGMGVSDIRKIARALKRAEQELGQRRQIIAVSGEGGARNAKGMQSVCFLPGAIIEIADGVLIGTGPAWLWSYPNKSAVYHKALRVTLDVTTPGAKNWKPYRRTV